MQLLKCLKALTSPEQRLLIPLAIVVDELNGGLVDRGSLTIAAPRFHSKSSIITIQYA